VGGTADAATVLIGDADPLPASLVRLGADTASLELDGIVHTFRIVAADGTTWIGQNGWSVGLRLRGRADRLAEELAAITRPAGTANPEIRSPMPGTVVAVSVATGDRVTTGQTLVRVEAMKMEHQLTATANGIVTITIRPADLVSLDQVVATITPHPQEEKPA